MRLRVSLRHPGTAETSNLQITADATATVHDVAETLAGMLGQDAEASLTLRAAASGGGQSRLVSGETALIDSGIQSGAVLELSSDPAARRGTPGDAAALLRVLSGPDRGIEVPLAIGQSEIGRNPACGVQLTDRRVSARHARVLVGLDKIEVIDLNSSNGVLIGGLRQSRAVLGAQDVVTIGDTEFKVTYLRTQPQWSTSDVAFVRSPRVLGRPTITEVAIPEPPGPLEQGRFPWLAMFAPLVMGVVLFLFTKSIMSVVFVAMSPLLMIGSWVTSRLEAKSRQKRALSHFGERLSAAARKTAELQERERAQLAALYPSAADCVAAIPERGGLIWSRRPENPEFLQLRLGTGMIASHIEPDYRVGEGLADLAVEAETLARTARSLDDAPVIVDLRSVGSVGICGRREIAEGLAKALVVQLASLHSPAEALICCLTCSAHRPCWQWIEWLPHTSSAHSPLNMHLAADQAAGREVVDQLDGLVAARRAELRGEGLARGPLPEQEQVPSPVLPSVVVLVDEPPVDLARLTRLAEQGPDVGVHLIWVGEDLNSLPAACRTFLDVGRGEEPAVGQVRSGVLMQQVSCEIVDDHTAEVIARSFAPLIDAGAPIDDDSDLPRSVSVVSLLGPAEVDDPALVVERWRENGSLIHRDGRAPQRADQPAALRAIVGHGGSGPLVIDMRRDGPHALVGGTTGAGKSEFLQAWVLGLAHALSPDRVNFLFVDYKGGTAFAKCVELPHCVGLVTDLNPYLVRRVLTSLRAELKRREHILNTHGKKDLIDFEISGDPGCPPSLIIVVDEFAALASEIPEFVDGMVDIAQRGRSLGLHLILATQRPAGVIKDNLRANTNLRIALRMADEQDSTDVLGSSMAAGFSSSMPGRGALKAGPGKITTFQSAYPGARTPSTPPTPPIEVTELRFGSGRHWTGADKTVASEDIPKDIDRVVTTLKRAVEIAQVPNPRRPWLSELQPCYNLIKLGQRRDTELVLGVLDDPDRQAQEVEYFRPDEAGNILYLGAGGSGKTTALRSLAIAASITPRSGPVHVYGMDFAGGGLAFLEPMPNVGSIISGDDGERIERLLRYLTGLVEERASRYSAARASTLPEYRELAGRPDEPRLLILMDGFGAFREQYEMAVGGLFTDFTRLLVDGRAVGVHIAMTVDRATGVPTSVTAAFGQRVVLRQADDEAYLMLGVPKDVLNPLSPPGRAMQTGRHQELQLAILGDNVAAAEQARLVEEMAKVSEQHHALRPVPIRSLPAMIPAAQLPTTVGGLPVLGIADRELAPIGFMPRSTIVVTGPSGSGKTTAMHWLAHSLVVSGQPADLYHLSLGRSPLASLTIWMRSYVGEDEVAAAVSDLKSRASLAIDQGRFLAVFVEALPDVIGTSAEYPLAELVQVLRKNGHLVVADGEMAGWQGHWPVLNEIRNQRCGLLLQPEQLDGDSLLRTSLPKCRRSDFPIGRGFWVKGGTALKVQIPMLD